MATGCLDDEPPDNLPHTIQNNQRWTQKDHNKSHTEEDGRIFLYERACEEQIQNIHSPPLPSRRSIDKLNSFKKLSEQCQEI
jgi:hypothetical protein